MPANYRRILVVAFALLSIGFALTAGARQRQVAFLTRGIAEPWHPASPELFPDRLGLNVALEQYSAEALEENLLRINRTGVHFVKQSFYYAADFDWDAAEFMLWRIVSNGLEPVVLLDGNPDDSFAPPDPDEYARFAAEFAQRFGDSVYAYIIWDEPNLAAHWGNQKANPDDYAALLTAAAGAIRAADPDALIVAAPLAPTVETDSINLADPLFLQGLYDAGADFDVVAAKPYGFDSGPDDRRVALDVLNSSRAILLRDVMVRNGDDDAPLWFGNWGWNSHAASIWGEATVEEQVAWTAAFVERARSEWPWVGLMFLETWEPDADADDPIQGFAVKESPLENELLAIVERWRDLPAKAALPGYHAAEPDGKGQAYSGDWRFSAEFGADVSRKIDDEPRDSMTITFFGTGIAAHVRRSDQRARFYATVDGQPANALPQDDIGATLVLDSPDPLQDYIAIEPIATGLPLGTHTLALTAERGWDQWALKGFSVTNLPPVAERDGWQTALAVLSFSALVGATALFRPNDWGPSGRRLRDRYLALQDSTQIAMIASLTSLVTLTGWFSYGPLAAGVYRRLGDWQQLALTGAAAAVFYVTPTFVVYLAALAILFLLLTWRPAWGLVLICAVLPFHVRPKPMLGLIFSPLEVITLLTFLAWLTASVGQQLRHYRAHGSITPFRWRWVSADWAVAALFTVATLSLLTTERIDVAANEWRSIILEATIFYTLLRLIPLSSKMRWHLIDGFLLGGVCVALFGLGEYLFGFDRIIAEGSLPRLRSIYGSPNNVALLLGRMLPLPLALILLGDATLGPRRRWYLAALVPLGLAFLFTFSKGGLLIGFPSALLLLLIFWLRQAGKNVLVWTAGALIVGVVGFLLLLQIPAIAPRLDPRGDTTFLRVNLWLASLQMLRDHLWTGVGLDNFLYSYRSRYIYAAAWADPNLSHPHNWLLDFGTRLGIFGLGIGVWLMWLFGRNAFERANSPLTVGILAAFAHLFMHGLVDHSFFLADLAFSFYLLLYLATQTEFMCN